MLVRNFLSPAEAAAVVALARRSGRTWLRSSGGGEYRHEDTVEDETEADGADAEEGEAPPADETRRVSGRSNRWCCVGSEHAVLAAAVETKRALEGCVRLTASRHTHSCGQVERACWLTGLTAAHAEEVQVVHYTAGLQPASTPCPRHVHDMPETCPCRRGSSTATTSTISPAATSSPRASCCLAEARGSRSSSRK